MKYGLEDYQLKTIIHYLEKKIEVEEAVLFGSRAIGTYKKASDVDIALKGKNVNSFVSAALKSEIEDETTLPYFFDFVSYSQLTNTDLIKHIDTNGISIFKRFLN